MAREGEVKKERTTQSQREQYVNLVTQSFESSRDTFSVQFRRMNRWYKTYRSFKTGKYIPYRNNISIPLLFSIVQSDTAKKLQMLFGQMPWIKFMAVGPEDQMLARKREALINVQLADADSHDKATQMLTGASIFGTQPYKYFWDIRKELVKFRADLGTGEQSYANDEVTFDGPNWEPVDVRNFFPAPGFSRINKMPFVVERFFLEKEDINRLAEAGFFSKRGASDVQTSPLFPHGAQDEFLTGSNPATAGIEQDFKRTDFQKPVEILQYWGRVPRSLGIDGNTNLVITVASRKHLLRADPNPHGQIPFGAYAPMPDPWYFHSPSKVEVGEKLQIASNAMASQKLDVLNIFADPMFAYSKRSGAPKRLFSRPGAWLGFEGDVGPTNIQPLTPDLRGLQNLYNELEQQAQWTEQGTGIIRDAIQGLGGPDRETARGFLGRQEGANVRLLMEARVAEQQWLEPLAMRFVRLNREFLTFPRQVRMIGASSFLDPVTLQQIPNEASVFTVNDLLPDYEARAVGATRSIGNAAQLQNMILLLQTVQVNPVAIQMVNWFNFFRQLFILAEIPNPDELLGTDSVVMQAMQNALAQGLQQGTQGGGQAAPAAPRQNNVVPLPTLAG